MQQPTPTGMQRDIVSLLTTNRHLGVWKLLFEDPFYRKNHPKGVSDSNQKYQCKLPNKTKIEAAQNSSNKEDSLPHILHSFSCIGLGKGPNLYIAHGSFGPIAIEPIDFLGWVFFKIQATDPKNKSRSA